MSSDELRCASCQHRLTLQCTLYSSCCVHFKLPIPSSSTTNDCSKGVRNHATLISTTLIERAVYSNGERCPSMKEILQSGTSRLKNKKMQRAANALQWRQKFLGAESYLLELSDGRSFGFHQVDNGELKGIGTGAIVWPAAHVLAMYLEKRFGSNGLAGARVCDIGSGTGITGIIASALGAKETFLTDQASVKSLLLQNIARSSGVVHNICFAEYNWESSPSHLSPPFDLILVSDCVLPKLYPIEPLVKAVSSLMSNQSIAIFSYEHRPYPDFDPRDEFCRLAGIYGLDVRKIPLGSQHSFYCCDEIEIWEVSSRDFFYNPKSLIHSTCFKHVPKKEVSSLKVLSWGNVAESQMQLSYVNSTANQVIVRELTIKQDSQSDIGKYLWPSAVALSRYLLMHPSRDSFRKELERISSSKCERGVSWALDLGAGCGLTSIILSDVCEFNVLAVDKEPVMGLLNENLDKNCSSRLCPNASGPICIARCFNWNTALNGPSEHIRHALQWPNSKVDCPPELIVLSDCFYQHDAVAPVLEIIDALAGNNTFVIVANELRTSFDTFTNKMNGRPGWRYEEISLAEEDVELMVNGKNDARNISTRLLIYFKTSVDKLSRTP